MNERKQVRRLESWFDKFMARDPKCGGCGKRVRAWDRFCTHCGARLLDDECPHCRMNLHDKATDNFCRYCGAKFVIGTEAPK